jgi:uncharacterized protein YneR
VYKRQKKALPIIENTIKKNYELAFSQTAKRKGFTDNYQSSDMTAHRIIVNPEWSGADLVNNLNNSADKTLPYALPKSAKNDGWKTAWEGTLEFKNNTMTIGTDKQLESTLAYLDGTGNWTDYAIKSEMDCRTAENISLLVRYTDDGNFVAINMNKKEITLTEEIDGVTHTIEKVQFKKNRNIIFAELSVCNNTVSLSLDGRKMICGNFDGSKLKKGGIGFNISSEKPGTAEICVKSLMVSNTSCDLKSRYSLKGGCNPIKDPIAWNIIYGDLMFQDKCLALSAQPNNNGVMAVIKETKNMRAYHLKTGFSLKAGSDINLLFRYRDNNNYACINIGRGALQVAQVVGGKKQIIKNNPIVKTASGLNYNIEFFVTNNRVSALINGQNISGLVDPALSSGCFGLEVWCGKPNSAHIVMKQLSIES